MKQIPKMFFVCALQGFLLSAFVHAEADAKPAPNMGDVLAKAVAAYDAIPKREVTEKEALAAAKPFVALLQSVADRFESVEPGTESGKASWGAHVLNKEGKGLDCIRFRTPKGEPREMAWSFVSNANSIESWYILPAKGEPSAAFKDFFDLTGSGADAPSVFVQFLSADSLKPDTEYLLWFKLHGPDPVEVMTVINLLPKGTIQDNPEQLSRAVSLTAGVREFLSLRQKRTNKN